MQKTAVKPARIIEAIKKGLENFEKVIIVTVSSKLSAGFSVTESLKKTFFRNSDKILVVDSQNGASGEGLIALRIRELIDEGNDLEEIKKNIEKLVPKVKHFVIMGDLRWVGKRGRMPKVISYLLYYLQKTGIIKIVMTLKDGRFKPIFQFFSFNNDSESIFKEIKKRIATKRVKLAITHIDNLKEAERLEKLIVDEIPFSKIEYVSPGNPMDASILAPGALTCAFYEEDYGE